ncbi:hypothetical protein OY671_009607, partial [Metschnikowia pulcherrima]
VLSATRFVNITLCVISSIGSAGHSSRQRTRFRPNWRHYALVGCSFVAIIASQWFGLSPGRYETSGEGVTARSAIWRQCFVMFFERPLSGYGLAAFPAVYAHFSPDPRTAARIWTVNSPHDVVFQLLSTGGVVYSVSIESAAVFVAMPIFLAIRRGSARTGDRVSCVMVSIMLGSASIDITSDYPSSIGIFGLLTGLSLGQS